METITILCLEKDSNLLTLLRKILSFACLQTPFHDQGILNGLSGSLVVRWIGKGEKQHLDQGELEGEQPFAYLPHYTNDKQSIMSTGGCENAITSQHLKL